MKLEASALQRLMLATVGLDESQIGQDAAYLEIDGASLLHSIDLITAVHDDPSVWGAVAVEHALADIYATGGFPMAALVVFGVPRTMSDDISRGVLQACVDRVRQAGCSVQGGHTYYDEEPKIGLAVLGRSDGAPLRKEGARAGDKVFLTKPIGSGIHIAFHAASGAPIRDAVDVMLDTNAQSAVSAVRLAVNSCTDVSGFGLLGHAREVASMSGVTIRLRASAVPLIPRTLELASDGYVPAGTIRNVLDCRLDTRFLSPPSVELEYVMADSQTSGGLLTCGEDGPGTEIGSVVTREASLVVVEDW